MKKLIYIFIALVSSYSLTSCLQGDEFDSPMINPDSDFQLNSSADEVVLISDREDDIAFTLSWLEVDYGFDSAIPSFEIYLEGNYMASVNGYIYSPTVKEVNNILIDKEIALPNTATDVEIEVVANLGTSDVASSVMMNMTPYAVDPVWLDGWGLVGGAVNNWGETPDQPFFKIEDQEGVLITYFTFSDGEWKFRLNNDWGTNRGTDGTANGLTQDGGNIATVAGMFRVVYDTNNETYTKTEAATTWGIVGSAYNDWGATPDAPMYISENPDVFEAYVYLMEGEFKFRENNAWDNNVGGSSEPGVIGGDNIAVPYESWYRIRLNLVDGTYEMQAFQ